MAAARHVDRTAAAAAPTAPLPLLLLLLVALLLAATTPQAYAAPAAAGPASAQTPSSRGGYTLIPDMEPYPRLGPSDDGYPGNLPSDLPTGLPEAPPVLVEGSQTECAPDATVEAVLRAHGRRGMISLLKASPIGAQVLSGRAMATVLAPPDAAVAALKLSPAEVNRNPLLATTFSNYHVIQGLRPLGVMAADPLRNWNTTLSDSYCPTAYQTVSSLTRDTAAGGALDSAAAAAQDEVYLRSAVSTARVVKADVVACNSVVHMIDRVLDPCCRSLWEQLPSLSVVSLTPSYFDGFKAPPPPGNDDASNRRIFEEQLLDSLLYMTYRNSTRTVLWPAPSAWDGFSLARALGPSVPLDSLAARTRALKMMALYGLSYGQLLLPKDYGLGVTDPNEAAQLALQAQQMPLPFVSALHNVTRAGVWQCKGTLSLVAGKAAAMATPAAAIDASQANTGRPAKDGKPVVALSTLATAASGRGVVAAPKRAPASPRVLPAQGPIDEQAAAAMAAAGGGEGAAAQQGVPFAAAAPAAAAPPPARQQQQQQQRPTAAAAAGPPQRASPPPQQQQQQWPRQQPAANAFLVEDPEQIGEYEAASQDYGTAEEEQQQEEQQAATPAPAPVPAPTTPTMRGAPAAPVPAPARAAAAAAPVPVPAAPAAPATATAPALVASQPLATASAASAAPTPIPTLLVEGSGAEEEEQAAAAEEQAQQEEEEAASGGARRRRRGRNSQRRRRLAQAGTQELTIVGTYETCEGIRILLVDAVPVPCDFSELVKQAKTVEAQMDAFALPVRQTVESYYTDLKLKGGAGDARGGGWWRAAATLGLGGALAAMV
jgi:uncharacterized surface protein with fasciclin (FAS1) repeats